MPLLRAECRLTSVRLSPFFPLTSLSPETPLTMITRWTTEFYNRLNSRLPVESSGPTQATYKMQLLSSSPTIHLLPSSWEGNRPMSHRVSPFSCLPWMKSLCLVRVKRCALALELYDLMSTPLLNHRGLPLLGVEWMR